MTSTDNPQEPNFIFFLGLVLQLAQTRGRWSPGNRCFQQLFLHGEPEMAKKSRLKFRWYQTVDNQPQVSGSGLVVQCVQDHPNGLE